MQIKVRNRRNPKRTVGSVKNAVRDASGIWQYFRVEVYN
jgi:hypothetical protein